MNNLSSAQSEMELKALYRISQRTVVQHDIASLLHDVLDILHAEIGIEQASFALRQPDSAEFMVEASRGMPQEKEGKTCFSEGDGIRGRVAKTMEAALIPFGEGAHSAPSPSSYNTKKAFLCVPVIHQRIVIGIMSAEVDHAPIDHLRHNLRFLNLVSGVLAEGVSRIREDKEEHELLIQENQRLRQQLGNVSHPEDIIGNCRSMKQVYTQIAQVADSLANVLIRGESGTGKELAARAIHYSSSRRSNAFVAVNCAALPESLIESELFGHEKGAFTGAAYLRKGRFELANGGTLFLDEIGDISPAVQVRLLRALQERSIERVGSQQSININARIVAATSRNLEQAMAEGSFREDLYYRLNVFPIHLPPLRDRRSDMMLLADHFIERYSAAYSKKIRRISSAAIGMMMSYHWPGNVRELENCIEHAVLTSQDEVIHGYSLPPSLQTAEQTNTSFLPDSGGSLKNMMDSYEREIIIDALKKHNGNTSAVARYLRTSVRIMAYSLKRLGIQASTYKR